MGWWTGQHGQADERQGLGRGAPKAHRLHHLFYQRARAAPPLTLTHSGQRGSPPQHLRLHGVYLSVVISIPPERSVPLSEPSGAEGRT